MSALRRVGIVGYGAVGQYLARAILSNPRCTARLELAFAFDARPGVVEADESVPAECRLASLADFAVMRPDLVVEVAHQSVSRDYGAAFLRVADYMPASITAFADPDVERAMLAAADVPNGTGIYLPRGALWGAEDLQRMAADGTLAGLTVTMKKAPHHIKAEGAAKALLDAAVAAGTPGETVLYEGPVRGLCPQAPNNVNTMAAASLAARNLGLDGVVGRLVSDPSLDKHVVQVDVTGPAKPGGEPFRVSTVRLNPAEKGAVTGDATYASFLGSLLAAGGRGDGVHFC